MHRINGIKRTGTKTPSVPRFLSVLRMFFSGASYVPKSISQINFIASQSCACSEKLLEKLPGRFLFQLFCSHSWMSFAVLHDARKCAVCAASEVKSQSDWTLFLCESVFVRVLNGTDFFPTISLTVLRFFCPPQSYLIKTKWKNEANAIRTMYPRHRWFIFQFQYIEQPANDDSNKSDCGISIGHKRKGLCTSVVIRYSN